MEKCIGCSYLKINQYHPNQYVDAKCLYRTKTGKRIAYASSVTGTFVTSEFKFKQITEILDKKTIPKWCPLKDGDKTNREKIINFNFEIEFANCDEHRNGHGWWESVNVQARILSREVAWKSIGVNSIASSRLSNYNIQPNTIKELVLENIKIPCVGPKGIEQIKALTDKEFKTFNNVFDQHYNDKKSWVYRYAESLSGWHGNPKYEKN